MHFVLILISDIKVQNFGGQRFEVQCYLKASDQNRLKKILLHRRGRHILSRSVTREAS